MRPAVTLELDFQIRRGLLKLAKGLFNWQFPDENSVRLEDLVDVGWYLMGTPEQVAEKLSKFFNASGGFGTLLIVTGKNWADRERRLRSLRRFMEQVAPLLRNLIPSREPETGNLLANAVAAAR